MNQPDSDDGRWLTPDKLGGDVLNPQSLNRYAYALNNPTTLTDPLGLYANGPGDLCGNPTFGNLDAACSGNPACDEYGICLPSFPYVPINYQNHTVQDNAIPLPTAAPAGQPPLAGGAGYGPFGCPFPYNSMGLCGLAPDYYTGQVGVALNYNVWGLNGNLFFGLAFDLHGHFGLYYGHGYGVGGGPGASSSLGGEFEWSNADTICGLRDRFYAASGTFGMEGLGGTGDVFQGKGNGPNGTVTGGGGTIGIAGGVSSSVTETNTRIVPIRGTCP